MIRFIILILFSSIVMSIVAWAEPVTLPWATSFENCDETGYQDDGWASGTEKTVWNNVNVGRDGPVCSSNGYQKVSNSANFEGGAGGCGWRRWVCGADSTPAPSTGSIIINFRNEEAEIWVRWYERWQKGFEWNSKKGLFFQKLVYIRPFGSGIVMDLQGPDRMTMSAQSGRGIGRGTTFFANCYSCGWNAMNPTGALQRNGVRLGDGSWHSIEFHFKNQSGPGKYDGEWDLWIDGELKSQLRKINWFSKYNNGIKSLQFMINQMTPSNQVPMYNDIDDIAISNMGHIGQYIRQFEPSSK